MYLIKSVWLLTCFVVLVVFLIVYSIDRQPATVPFKVVQAVGYGSTTTTASEFPNSDEILSLHSAKQQNYDTVDGVTWTQGRVLLLQQSDLTDGFYLKVNGKIQLEEPVTNTSFFEVQVLGGTFAQQQLFLVGPTMTFTKFNTVSSGLSETVENLRVIGNSTVGGDVIMGPGGTVNGEDLAAVNTQVQTWPSAVNALSEFQVTQLATMGSNTISSAAWSSLGLLDQNVATTSAITLAGINPGSALSPLPREIVLDTTPGVDKVEAFPAGALGLIVEVQAAGGGGGSRGSTNDSGGGGGSGSLAIVLLTASQMASHTGLKFTIGAGGGQGATGAGSTLSWSGGSEDLIVTTFGGGGGGSGNNYARGGIGGNLPTYESGYYGWSKYGNNGTNGYDRGSTQHKIPGGQGGSTLRGVGARGSQDTAGGAAVPGTLGGGGGGGITQSNLYNGSAGGDGYVRILAF